MAVYCYGCMTEFQANLQECPACGARIPYYATDARDCPPGTVLRNRYLVGKALGRGGFGVSYIAVDLTNNRKLCIKECNLKDRTYRDPYDPVRLLPKDNGESAEEFETFKNNLSKECEALKTLRHIPDVVHYVDHFACNNTTYLVMEYLEGRDLKHYVLKERSASNPLSIDETVYYTIRVLNILSEVHKKGLLHRDISPDNIYMLTDGSVKLIDFGSARSLSTGDATGFQKAGYTAPEMLAGDKEGPYTDIYSVGAVMYFLLTGKKPIPPVDGKSLTPPPESCSTPELTAIFNKAVQRNPKNRYRSADEMAQALIEFRNQFLADADSSPVTHTTTRTVTVLRKHSRKLMIGTVSALLLLLLAIIIAVGSGSISTPTSTPTPVPVQSTQRATATPTPSPTPTATPTLVPTHTPVPALLRIRPDDAYTLLTGSAVDVPLAFNEAGAFDLQLTYDAEVLSIDASAPDHLRVTALTAGTSEVAYFDGQQQRTFRVTAYAHPALRMLTAESDTLMFSPDPQGGTLFLPRGAQAQLLAQGLVEPALLARSEGDACADLTIAAGEDGQTLTITATDVGEQTYRLYADDMTLYTLQVTVTPHAVAGDLQQHYTLYEGCSLTLDITFTDGAALDLSQDVTLSSSCLEASITESGALQLLGVKPGVADVSINGQLFRVTVADRPALHGNMLTASRSETAYSLTLPEGENTTLTLTGVLDQLPIAIAQDEVTPTAQLRGTTVLLDTSVPGDHPYTFQCDGQTLFTLALHVEELGLSTQFADHYDLYASTKDSTGLTLPLSFIGDRAFDLTGCLAVEGECISAQIVTDEDGVPALCIDALQAGVATVTLDEQSFQVEVHALAPRLTFASSKQKLTLTPDAEGNYALDITPAELGTLAITDLPDDLELHLSPVDSDASAVAFDLDERQLTITQALEGSACFALSVSDAQGCSIPLFDLTVSVAPPRQLLTRFEERYILMPGEQETVSLSFEDDHVFSMELIIDDPDVVSLTQEGAALTLSAQTTGETTVTVDGQTFTVQVLPLPTLSSDRLTRDGDSYSLTLDAGETVTMNVLDGFMMDRYTFGWSASADLTLAPQMTDNTLTGITLTGESAYTTEVTCYAVTLDDEQWLPLFDLTITVKEPAAQLLTTFNNHYDDLPGGNFYISLTYSGTNHDAPAISVADESIVRASLATGGENLYIQCLKAGSTTVTFDDQTFTVNVFPLVYPRGDLTSTGEGENCFTMDMVVGETVTMDYYVNADGTAYQPGSYDVTVAPASTDDDVALTMLYADDRQMTLTATQPGSYTFIGTGTFPSGIFRPIFSLTVNVFEPAAQLTTQFDPSYTMLLGESTYIPLSGTGDLSDIEVSCETMGVRVADSRLYLDATTDGQHTVTVRLGESQQSFFVNVLTPRAVWSQNNFVLPQDAEGNYLLTMHADSTVSLTLSCTGLIDSIICSRYSDDFAASEMTFRFGNTFSYTLTSGNALQEPSPITACATLPETRGATAMYATMQEMELSTLLVTVEDVWQLSDTRVCTLTDDTDTVVLDVCRALKALGLLKGDATMHAARAIENSGALRSDLWALMEEVRTSYEGFSTESYYTREDYDRLLALGAEAEAAAEAAAEEAEASKSAADAPVSTEEKTRFYIVGAAADANALYLLDEDGYLIQYDRDLTHCQQVWEKHDFTLLAGSGTRVLAERDNSSYVLLGDYDDATIALLDNCATDLSAAAITPSSLLLLLGSDGIFAVENDKRLNPDGEDMFLEEGQAVYLWPDSEAVMGVSINRESTAAENILMAVSGENTIAILCETEDKQTLYLKSTARGTALAKKVGTLNQSSRLFVKVEAALGSDKVALDAAAIAVSNDDLAVVQQDGTVYILGANDRYQCGTGANRERQYFQQVLQGEDQPLRGITQVALLDGYTLLLAEDGQVWICGSCNGVDYRYARTLPGISGVGRMVRIDENQVLLIDYNGQVMLLRHGQPLNNGNFMNVQR